jgi:hypothetical protein
MAQFSTNFQRGSPIDLPKHTDGMMGMEGTLLTEEFVKQVSENRYLIILEDLSSTVDWEAVKIYLPDKKNGSCIIVHTQQLEVASLCVGQSHRVLELQRFSDDHSVCVFFNEVCSKNIILALFSFSFSHFQHQNIYYLLHPFQFIGHFDICRYTTFIM